MFVQFGAYSPLEGAFSGLVGTMFRVQRKCNACIYSCLCGSLLESMQEGKAEIIYQFRQTQF